MDFCDFFLWVTFKGISIRNPSTAGLSTYGTQRSVATPQPLRTLNGKLLHLSHLKVSNRRQTSAVLNGILRGAPLNATALMVP